LKLSDAATEQQQYAHKQLRTVEESIPGVQSYLADDSAADVENQKPKVVLVSTAAAGDGGGVCASLGLIADRCVQTADSAPASARATTTTSTHTVRLVAVEHGHVVRVAGTRPDGQDTLDRWNSAAAAEVVGVVRGTGGGVGAQRHGGEVRVDVVRRRLVV